jgi:hypothetical protein
MSTDGSGVSKQAFEDLKKARAQLAAQLAPAPPPAQPVAQNTGGPPSKLLAWKLGSQFTFAVTLGHRSGNDHEVTKSVYAKAKKIADLAGLDIPAPPPKQDLPQLLGFINKSTKALSDKIATKYGKDHATLFDMASMSVTLLLLYELEDTKINKQFADGIASRGKETGIPEKFWQPLVRMIEGKAPYNDIKSEVLKMDDDVAEHFAKGGK